MDIPMEPNVRDTRKQANKDTIQCSKKKTKKQSIHLSLPQQDNQCVVSLVMPNSDAWDGFFYPTLILMIDSYNIRNV